MVFPIFDPTSSTLVDEGHWPVIINDGSDIPITRARFRRGHAHYVVFFFQTCGDFDFPYVLFAWLLLYKQELQLRNAVRRHVPAMLAGMFVFDKVGLFLSGKRMGIRWAWSQPPTTWKSPVVGEQWLSAVQGQVVLSSRSLGAWCPSVHVHSTIFFSEIFWGKVSFLVFPSHDQANSTSYLLVVANTL